MIFFPFQICEYKNIKIIIISNLCTFQILNYKKTKMDFFIKMEFIYFLLRNIFNALKYYDWPEDFIFGLLFEKLKISFCSF